MAFLIKCASVSLPYLPGMHSAAFYCHVACVTVTFFFFPHHFINGTFLRKILLDIKYVFCFSPQLPSETFLILRRIQQDIVTDVNTSSYTVPVIVVSL
jgi:hypothetical protein